MPQSKRSFNREQIVDICRNVDKKIGLSKSYQESGILPYDMVSQFLDDCFQEAIEKQKAWSFQARAKVSGDMFEVAFEYIMKEFFGITLISNYPIPSICMPKGVASADFVLLSKTASFGENPIRCVIEAKGSALRVKTPDGKIEELHRPGLMRSDTVKKALANALLVKRGTELGKLPRGTKFYLVTNSIPQKGTTSRCMLDMAIGVIVDHIYDITRKEDLQNIANDLRQILKQAT
jgi:hypothetical protein